MRISTDPNDPAYLDARARRVLCNDVMIEGWVVADEFRRCVITSDGKVHHGSVCIERLPAEGKVVTGDDSGEAPPPINTGFIGVFESKPDAPRQPEPAAAPAPAAEAPVEKAAGGKRRR